MLSHPARVVGADSAPAEGVFRSVQKLARAPQPPTTMSHLSKPLTSFLINDILSSKEEASAASMTSAAASSAAALHYHHRLIAAPVAPAMPRSHLSLQQRRHLHQLQHFPLYHPHLAQQSYGRPVPLEALTAPMNTSSSDEDAAEGAPQAAETQSSPSSASPTESSFLSSSLSLTGTTSTFLSSSLSSTASSSVRDAILGQIRLLHSSSSSSASQRRRSSPDEAAETVSSAMTAHIGGGDETDSEDEIDVENVAEEEEEEEDVMEAPPKPASKGSSGKRKRGSAEKEDPDGVSPLDALLQMTSKAFDGRQDAKNQGESRDHLHLFSKSQPPKKRRKSRTAFTNQQIYELEKRFLYQKYLSPADRDQIAQTLGLTNAQVITWFQNRRAKMKRDLEELKADVKAAKMHSAQSIEFLKKFNMVESTEQQPKRADESSSGSSSLDAASGQESDSGTTEKDHSAIAPSSRHPSFLPRSGSTFSSSSSSSAFPLNSAPTTMTTIPRTTTTNGAIPSLPTSLPPPRFYPDAYLLGRVNVGALEARAFGPHRHPGAAFRPLTTTSSSSASSPPHPSLPPLPEGAVSLTRHSPLEIDVESVSASPRGVTGTADAAYRRHHPSSPVNPGTVSATPRRHHPSLSPGNASRSSKTSCSPSSSPSLSPNPDLPLNLRKSASIDGQIAPELSSS